MRLTCKWVTDDGLTGEMPGRFATAEDAAISAQAFMGVHSAIVRVIIFHETEGWLAEVLRDGTITNRERAH